MQGVHQHSCKADGRHKASSAQPNLYRRALAQQRHLQHMRADIQAREERAQQAREAALEQGAPPKRQYTPAQQAAFIKRLAGQQAKSKTIK